MTIAGFNTDGDALWPVGSEVDGEFSDGSLLWIGDQKIVDNDGDHGPVTEGGLVALEAGTHPIRMLFYQNGSGFEFDVFWSGPGVAREPIPASAFSLD